MRGIDLSDQCFGKLLVKKRAASYRRPCGQSVIKWICVCDCGNRTIVAGAKLRGGNTASCGCLQKENRLKIKLRATTHGHSSNGIRTKEYRAWSQAKSRCYRLKDRGYKNYGARGINMCEKWKKSFEAFIKDMGPCPPGRSLERIDVNGNYEPTNCRWATTLEQHNNRRDNQYVEIAGERLTVAQASRRMGVPAHRIYSRITKGQSIEKGLH